MRRVALALGTAGSLLLGGFSPALAADDTTAPVVTDVEALDTAVDVTTGPRSVLFAVTAHDLDDEGGPGAGISYVFVTLTSPSTATSVDAYLQQQGGAGGVYLVKAELPQGSEAGHWDVTSVRVDDYAGNEHLAPPASPLGVDVTAGTDTTAPTLVGSVTHDPVGPVDATAADVPVTWSAHLTDSTSGVSSASLEITGPDGPQQLTLARASGTTLDGTWTTTQYVPRKTVATFSPTGLTVTDGYGNTDTLTSGLGSDLSVTSLGDTTAPVLTVTSVTPKADVTYGSPNLVATVHVVDAGVGFSYGSLTWNKDGDQSGPQISASFSLGELTSGTAQDGTYTLHPYAGSGLPAGTYTLTTASVYDSYGNGSTEVPTAPSITVVSKPDKAGPVLRGISIGTPTIATGGAVLAGSVHVTDDVTGVNSVSLTWTGVHTGQTVYGSTNTGFLLSGTKNDGVLQLNVQPYSVEPDTYRLTAATLYDNAFHTTQLTGAQLPPGGGFTLIALDETVTDTVAPTPLSVTPTTQTVDTRTSAAEGLIDLAVQDTGLLTAGSFYGQLQYHDQDGVRRTLYFAANQLVSGTVLRGTYRIRPSFPQDSPGTWTLDGITLGDRAGNNRAWSAAELASRGIRSTITVLGDDDRSAPVLTSAGAATPTVALGQYGGLVPITLTGTDTGSGLAQATATITGPDGSSYGETGIPYPDDVTIGISLPAAAAGGTYRLTGVVLRDGKGNERSYDGAALTALGLAPTVEVTAASAPVGLETTPPVVTSLRLLPTSVDTTDYTQSSVNVVARATDVGTGVNYVLVTLTSPTGAQSATATLFVTNGDNHDALLIGSTFLPTYVDAGTWKVTSVTVADYASNATTYDSPAELAGAGLDKTLAVTGPSDTDAPTLTSLDLSSHSEDATTVPVSDDLTVVANDTASATTSVRVTLLDPDGLTRQVVDLVQQSYGTGDTTWTGAVSFGSSPKAGAWQIGEVQLRDAAGNTRKVSSGYDGAIDVVALTDLDAPTLSSVRFFPPSVNVTAAPAPVVVRVSLVDDASGVFDGTLRVVSPNGKQALDVAIDDVHRVGGSFADGVWDVRVSVPRYAQAGTWHAVSAHLRDRVDHVRDVVVSGQPGLVVNDSAQDVTGPVLASTNLPTTVDARTSVKDAAVRVHVTDVRAGVAAVLLTVTRPGGSTVQQLARRVSGTAVDGVYQLSLPLSPSSQPGTWTLSSALLTDAFGNTTTRSGSGVPSPRAFSVLATPAVPGRPQVLGADARGTSALVLWIPPYDGGSALTGYAVTPYQDGVAKPSVPAGPDATELLVDGLAPGAAYAFTVTATNAVGTGAPSARSYPVVAAPRIPDAVPSLTGTAGDGVVDLSWTAPTVDGGSPITGYHVVLRDQDLDLVVSDTTTAATTAHLTGLVNGAHYYALVTALNAAGESQPGAAAFDLSPRTPGSGAPSAPTGVTATPAGGGQLSVSWTPGAANGSAVSSYRITATRAGQATRVLDVGTAVPAVITGLLGGPGWTVRVQARNALGLSPLSAASPPVTVAATAPGAPAVPTAARRDAAVQLSWAAPASNGGAAVTSYELLANGRVVYTGAATSRLVTGLTNGTAYLFAVRAVNAQGTGPLSPLTAAVVPARVFVLTAPSSVPTRSGSVATVTGRLFKEGTTTGVRNRLIRLQARVHGSSGPFTTIGYAVSGSGGAIVFHVRVSRTLDVRLLFAGASDAPQAVSVVRLLRVT